MPLVHAADQFDHARRTGYHVPAFELVSLDYVVPILEAVERNASSVILIFSADAGRLPVPALAAAARTAPDGTAVASGIRAGANNILLRPSAGTEQESVESTTALARASGGGHDAIG